jgi:transposase InsO family protein
MAPSTVGRILKRNDMGRLPAKGKRSGPTNRYERQTPGELIHIDIKKLATIREGAGKRITGRRSRPKGKGPGWERVHVAVDDCTRLAYAEVLPDEKAATSVGFLKRAKAFYKRYGIQTKAIITDNGPSYVSIAHAVACRGMGIKHLRTRPYRPQTNGKAERFIQTLTNNWAHGAFYKTNQQRTRALGGWLYDYNHHRNHTAIGRQPPVSRLRQRENQCCEI